MRCVCLRNNAGHQPHFDVGRQRNYRRVEPSGSSQRRPLAAKRHHRYQGNALPTADRSARTGKDLVS